MRLDATQIRDLFHRHQLRHTRQRELLYLSLASTTAHPTAEELYGIARAADSELSLATVYNTLDVFCSVSLAQRLPAAAGGPCRFDAITTEHAHVVHLDGTVTDVPEDLSRQLLAGLPQETLRELGERLGVPIGRISVQIHAGEKA
ncbi:MAG: transcriptional repressor [Planctomycetota bacterium]